MAKVFMLTEYALQYLKVIAYKVLLEIKKTLVILNAQNRENVIFDALTFFTSKYLKTNHSLQIFRRRKNSQSVIFSPM